MDLALTFDDVCLVPQYNNVNSRGDPIIDTWIAKNKRSLLPLVPSNMDTVISPELSDIVDVFGGHVIDHRFHSKDLNRLKDRIMLFGRSICISWGLKDWEGLELILQWGRDNGHVWGVCFDVAHGHCEGMFDIMDKTRKAFPDIEIIAGNVCTPLGYQELVSHGATAVKVGVGCGAACTTRMVTGFGVPQFSAIRNCADLARKLRVPIIADGGIRNSRDVILALAAGASTVMIGKLFAQCLESAALKLRRVDVGDITTFWDCNADRKYYALNDLENTKLLAEIPKKGSYAKYRGQASFDFQQEFYGEVRHAPEGEAFWVPVTGHAEEFLNSMIAAIKAGMTYAGARTISELQRKAEFMRVTPSYRQESETRR